MVAQDEKNPARAFTWDTLQKDAYFSPEGTTLSLLPTAPWYYNRHCYCCWAPCNSNVLFNFVTTIKISKAFCDALE